MPVLGQHVGHHEGGQLRVGVRVDEPVVGQRVAEVPGGVVLHQVEEGGLWVVGWSDWRDFVVLVASGIPAGVPGTATAAALTRVALGERQGQGREIMSDHIWFACMKSTEWELYIQRPGKVIVVLKLG